MGTVRRASVLVAVVAVAAATFGAISAESSPARADRAVVGPTIDELAYDMFGAPHRTDGRWKDGVRIGDAPWAAHDALPAGGRATWDWYHGARFGASAPWTDHVIPWGQLFAVDGNTEWDVRLQVRNVHMMYLDGDGRWHDVVGDVRDGRMDGAFWDEFFRGQGSTVAEEGIRDEAANGGGWSVRLASMRDKPNYVTWHWFYSQDFYPRPAVPSDARAVLSAAEMRLIGDGGDPAAASFIASFGADHWPVATGGKPDGRQITPFFQPRMRFVDEDWAWFSGHTFVDWFDEDGEPVAELMNDDLIRAFPPPIVSTTSDATPPTTLPTTIPTAEQSSDEDSSVVVRSPASGDDPSVDPLGIAETKLAAAERVGAARRGRDG